MTTTAAAETTRTDFDAATVEVADLTDDAIETLVREDGGAWETGAAQVLVYRVMHPEARLRRRIVALATKTHPAQFAYYTADGQTVMFSPLTHPAATLALLEWAGRQSWFVCVTRLTYGPGTWVVRWEGQWGDGWGDYGDERNGNVAAALVTAVLKAAAREARAARKTAESDAQTAHS